METSRFFLEQRENSAVKTEVVATYFEAWSNVIRTAKPERLQYFDLLAGAGRYEDGTPSTPLRVIDIAAKHEYLCERLQIVFHDRDEQALKKLKKEIISSPVARKLKNPPLVIQGDATDLDSRIVEASKKHPTFSFVDPFGYKALSRNVIGQLLKGWGNDVVFFFNYSDVNRALSNPVMERNMSDLFGQSVYNSLALELDKCAPRERRKVIIDAFIKAATDRLEAYALPFGFSGQGTHRESHHLIFLSKHFRGYEIMRDVMLKRNNRQGGSLSDLGFSDINKGYNFLFEFGENPDNLHIRLQEKHSNKALNRDDLYERDCIGTVFTKKDYNAALKKLEVEGNLEIKSSKPKRRVGQFKDVTFVIRKNRNGN